jgi:hypothetical protein
MQDAAQAIKIKEKALRGHPEGFLGGLTSPVIDSGQEQQILSA